MLANSLISEGDGLRQKSPGRIQEKINDQEDERSATALYEVMQLSVVILRCDAKVLNPIQLEVLENRCLHLLNHIKHQYSLRLIQSLNT